jgi:hypothetical protein
MSGSILSWKNSRTGRSLSSKKTSTTHRTWPEDILPLYQRAIAIVEKQSWAARDPILATNLEQYAVLLQKTHREPEAPRVKARAKVIRNTISLEN